MDAFYASVEQLKNPDLKGRPVVVGGSPQSRGVVSACSYEARQYGIHSAMPLAEARRRCPQTVFLPVDFASYRHFSSQMHKIFYDYTPLIEPIALDEAFLDVSGSLSLIGPAAVIGREIKERIKTELGLIASIGIAHNKFLAKLASDLSKPDGFMIVPADRVREFLEPLDINRIWGVGDKAANKLYSLNIKQVRDLHRLTEANLVNLFGTFGHQLYNLARGIDNRPVESDREAKSIGRETTFAVDVTDTAGLERHLLELSTDVGRSLRKKSLKGKTITIKIKYSDFRTVTRSVSLDVPTNLDETIYKEACRLLSNVPIEPTRLVGVSVHNFTDGEEAQLSWFQEKQEGNDRLAKAVDSVKDKYGEDILTRARLLKPKNKYNKE
jgi:DNA polymerase-4